MKANIYSVIVIFFAAAATITAVMPEDMSVAAYEGFKEEAENEVERLLENEFRNTEADIKRLSEPLKVGSQISISLNQGGRQRVVSGKFKGVKGNYAEIDERSILLTDVDDIDHQRLRIAGQVQVMQVEINKRRKKLDDDMARRREILLNERYKKAGYTRDFFDHTVRLGDTFWTLDALGHGKVRLRAKPSADRTLIDIELINGTGLESSAVIVVKKNGLYATALDTGDDEPASDREWKKMKFSILSEDLGEDFGKGIRSGLRLWVVKEDVGAWYLKPAIDSKRGAANDDEFVCSFKIIKSAISEYTKAFDRDYAKLVQDAGAYQQRIQDMVAEKERAVREAREARELEQKAREEEAQRREAERREKLKMVQEIEQNYIWVSADTAIRRNVKPVSPDKLRSTHEFDDYNFPTEMNGKRVLKFTNWEKIPSRSRVLYGRKYRMLNVIDGTPRYLLQYQASFMNASAEIADFKLDVAAGFGEGGDHTWSDTFEKLPPSWSGELMGASELPLENMKHRLTAVELSSDLIDNN